MLSHPNFHLQPFTIRASTKKDPLASSQGSPTIHLLCTYTNYIHILNISVTRPIQICSYFFRTRYIFKNCNPGVVKIVEFVFYRRANVFILYHITYFFTLIYFTGKITVNINRCYWCICIYKAHIYYFKYIFAICNLFGV